MKNALYHLFHMARLPKIRKMQRAGGDDTVVVLVCYPKDLLLAAIILFIPVYHDVCFTCRVFAVTCFSWLINRMPTPKNSQRSGTGCRRSRRRSRCHRSRPATRQFGYSLLKGSGTKNGLDMVRLLSEQLNNFQKRKYACHISDTGTGVEMSQ